MNVLALDAGGTNIRLAIVDANGVIHARLTRQAKLSSLNASSTHEAGGYVIRTLTVAIKKMLANRTGIQAIGIGFPGFFRQDTGILAASPNIPQLTEFPLAEQLARSLPLPVHIHNDATLAALGEFRFGTGRGKPALLHLTLGTGVGGGLVLNGVPYSGESGMAMEIGHLCVQPEGRPCGCGGTGCLEAYASATAVLDRYHEAGGCRATEAAEIYRRAKKKDAVAKQVLEEAGSALGYAIAQAVTLLDVHHASLSGGLTGAWDLLSPPLLERMNTRLIAPMKGTVEVHRSSLGDDAGLLGAAALALEAQR